MLRAAARRFLGLILLAVAVTVPVSLLLGVLAGASAARAISVGFYLIGCFLLISGFFVGNRGPARLKGEPGGIPFLGVFGNRRVRWATPDEQHEAINMSVLLVVLGFVLILFGIAADTRYDLV